MICEFFQQADFLQDAESADQRLLIDEE